MKKRCLHNGLLICDQLATAMVSGLISYFLGVDSHRAKIQQIADGLPDNAGYGWSEAIKKYLQDTSYPRGGPNGRPVMYNGAIPWTGAGHPVCPANPARKRQDGGPEGSSCIFEGTDPVSSASASLASASSASLASASSASLASISSASLASASSASLASLSSTQIASKTTTGALPTGKCCSASELDVVSRKAVNTLFDDLC